MDPLTPTSYDGGNASFRAVFEVHFGPLVGLARLLGSDDPEDTVADAFVSLHQNWSLLRDVAAAPAYVRSTVVRLCSNQRRHAAVRARHLRMVRLEDHPSAESVALGQIDGDLLAALAALTGPRRSAVVLRYYAGLPYEEIAQAIGCTTATARSHAQRGLADLRRTWAAGLDADATAQSTEGSERV